MPMQCNAELNMLCGLMLLLVERSKPLRVISMYVLIKFVQITKQRAWGGTYYYVRYCSLDLLPGPESIIRAAENPTVRDVA